MVDRAELRRRGTEVCRCLNQEVERLCPRGVGHWPEAWEMVDPAAAAFWEALSAWEGDPSEVSKKRVRRAYDEVLNAWRQAVAAWEREGASK